MESRRDLLVEVEQRARELIQFAAALRIEHRLAAIEKHLGLEHEAIADHPDIGTVAEDFPELAEKVRTIARQFLDALRERDVQSLAEIGDPRLGVTIL